MPVDKGTVKHYSTQSKFQTTQTPQPSDLPPKNKKHADRLQTTAGVDVDNDYTTMG